MNRKHNPLVAVVALLALAGIIFWQVTSSPAETYKAETPEQAEPTSVTIEPTIVEEEPVSEDPTPYIPELDDNEVDLIARTIWGEAGGVESKAEQAAVAWCILNRADAWGQNIWQVVGAPYQFIGYRGEGECPAEFYELAADVLTRWYLEKAGVGDVGRTLPKDYLFFVGDLVAHNYFSVEWQSTDYWDWSLPSPYQEDIERSASK